MKKVLCAMLVMAFMAVMFTSCKGDKADPTLEPIAGKTYRYDDPIYPGGYIKIKFHMNYNVTQEVLQNTGAQLQKSSKFKWAMQDSKYVEVTWKKGTGMLNPATGDIVDVSGSVFYHGTYDAATGDLHLYVTGSSQELVFHEVE